MTLPLCMPSAVSNSTPTHSPGANLAEPTYFTVPGFPFQDTFAPTAGGAAAAAAGGAEVAGADAAGADAGGDAPEEVSCEA